VRCSGTQSSGLLGPSVTDGTIGINVTLLQSVGN
jgi:hypothetical protein